VQYFYSVQVTTNSLNYREKVGEGILGAGRSIMLLDGLDEVKVQDHDRVINTIRQTAQQFDGNQFVMTCRIAAKEYVFEQFTEVEVADFDNQQIADFSSKWFKPKDLVKAMEFPQELKANPGLKELATNPLLLTLLCLVFEEGGRFPANRSELYKEGVDVLLKKWDAKRNIKREEVYKKLSLQRKEDLLSQVAYKAFEQNDYFFKQAFVEEQIRDYIRNLPNASSEPESLQLDSEAVLNSIAAQHGLLVERARGIYSFSHLTFQEYFTARWFKENADGDLSYFISNVINPQWREVFLLIVGMLKNADKLVQGMKLEIDSILSQDDSLQIFLDWVEKKSCSINSHYKPAAVRAYYFDLALALDLARALDITLDITFALALALDLDLEYTPDSARARAFALDLDLDLDLAGTSALALALDLDFVGARAIALEIAFEIESTDFQESLEQLNDRLPDCSLSKNENESFYDWWEANGREWIEQLRAIMIEHRDIGHDWQFSAAQTKLLWQYYHANKLLVDCLNSDCYVSREVREKIESTLLLPLG
jgi:predicted NACHT family NTPase